MDQHRFLLVILELGQKLIAPQQGLIELFQDDG
jgi:hypothetical protein